MTELKAAEEKKIRTLPDKKAKEKDRTGWHTRIKRRNEGQSGKNKKIITV